MLAADKTIHNLQPIYTEYNNIRWKGAKERFVAAHTDELQQYKKAHRLLHKFGLSQPIERKSLRAGKAQLEQDIDALRPEVEVWQSELDELKTVRCWVRKVIPDALPNRTENGTQSVRENIETYQNTNELTDLLAQTTKHVIVPNRMEKQQTKENQKNLTR